MKPARSDSSVAEPDSILIIHLEKSDSLVVRYVSDWPGGMVRYRTDDGQIRYISASKVRDIRDTKGKDRKKDILNRRRALGVEHPDERRSFGRFLAGSGPLRDASGFLITEFGIGAQLSAGPPGDGDALWHASLGGMKNLSRRWAVGGVAQAAVGRGSYHFLGLAARAKRYLNDRWSLDGAVGVFTEDSQDDQSAHGLPIYGEGAVAYSGILSVFTRIQRAEHRTARYFNYYPPILLSETDDSKVSLQMGLRLGPRPQMAIIPTMMLVTIAVAFVGVGGGAAF